MPIDDTIALVSLEDVVSYIGNRPQANGIWVYCDQGDASAATVQVTATALVLVITGGVQAGTNTLTFADADKDTLTELVAAVNALTGWKAGLVYNGGAASTDLVRTGAVPCLTAANEIKLKVYENYLLTKLVNSASDFLNRYCERNLKSKVYTHERYDGKGQKLILNNYPVTVIKQICDGTIDAVQIKYTSSTAYNAYARVTTTGVILTVDGVSGSELKFSSYATLALIAAAIAAVAGWEATVMTTDYEGWPSSQLYEKQNIYALNTYGYLAVPDEPLKSYEEDLENGIIYLSSEFSGGFRNIFVSYTAGYTTIPYMLEQICLELIKFKYNKRDKDQSLASEKIGSVYAYTLREVKDGLPQDMLMELESFGRYITVD